MGRSKAHPVAQKLVNVAHELLVFGLFVALANGQENTEAQVLTPSNFNIAQGRTVMHFQYHLLILKKNFNMQSGKWWALLQCIFIGNCERNMRIGIHWKRQRRSLLQTCRLRLPSSL